MQNMKCCTNDQSTSLQVQKPLVRDVENHLFRFPHSKKTKQKQIQNTKIYLKTEVNFLFAMYKFTILPTLPAYLCAYALPTLRVIFSSVGIIFLADLNEGSSI